MLESVCLERGEGLKREDNTGSLLVGTVLGSLLVRVLGFTGSLLVRVLGCIESSFDFDCIPKNLMQVEV